MRIILKTSTVAIILAVIVIVLLVIVVFNMGFDIGSSSSQMSDHERACLIKYGMTCERWTAEQLDIRPNP